MKDAPVPDVLGSYLRYTTWTNRHLLRTFPELAGCVFGDTMLEASEKALMILVRTLVSFDPIPVVEWVAHRPEEFAQDPLARFGSWGWKTAS